MAIATMVQEGDAIDYTPVADMLAGDVVDCGTFIGVALVPIPANVQGAITIEGVFDIAKSTSVAVGFGVSVFWDNTLKLATPTGPADASIGKCIKAALAADAVVRVKLIPGMA